MIGQHQLALRAWPSRPSIEAVLQDRLDRAVGAGADVEPAIAGRLEPLGAVLALQAQDAETGPVALLGVRAAGQDGGGELGGARADSGGRACEPLDRPLGM